MKTTTVFFGLIGLLVAPLPCSAQGQVPDLSQVSIEDLLSIEVTSASRKQQRAADVAAAVFVITHEDIRRSGMTSIPDLLRLAPGVDVAQINSNKWAVSVRGFNGLYANKLLVLVDGRSVYNRLFSGVVWDAQDLLLDDIERIEVIRGPGAALWGANAVNGVINIVTKATVDTHGGLVRVDAGGWGEQAAVRYGGTFGAGDYRLYSQWTGRDQSVLPSGTGADDASHSVTTGFRVDWAAQPGAFMLQGGFVAGTLRALFPNFNPQTAALEPIAKDPSESQGGYLLGRWTHTRANGASLQVQSFVDVTSRQEPLGDYSRRVADLDVQYHSALGAHHDLVAGAGYRFVHEGLGGAVGISLVPPEGNSSLVTAFVGDEIALAGNRLAVTLGSQVQYDSDAGAGVQPTARVMWTAFPRQRLWASTSRALRTPSLSERRIRLDYPPVPTASGLPLVVTLRGNPAAETETFVDAEAGYRIEVGTIGWVTATGFVGRYDHLQTVEPGIPSIQFVPSPYILVNTELSRLLGATTRGLEVVGHWAPVPAWHLEGSYTALRVTPHLDPTSRDPDAASEDGSAPGSQWQLRSALSLGPRATLNAALFHVGRLEQLDVAAYTRADINAEWQFTDRLSVTAIGQNLFHAAHAEFSGADPVVLTTQVARSASVRLRWTF